MYDIRRTNINRLESIACKTRYGRRATNRLSTQSQPACRHGQSVGAACPGPRVGAPNQANPTAEAAAIGDWRLQTGDSRWGRVAWPRARMPNEANPCDRGGRHCRLAIADWDSRRCKPPRSSRLCAERSQSARAYPRGRAAATEEGRNASNAFAERSQCGDRQYTHKRVMAI